MALVKVLSERAERELAEILREFLAGVRHDLGETLREVREPVQRTDRILGKLERAVDRVLTTGTGDA